METNQEVHNPSKDGGEKKKEDLSPNDCCDSIVHEKPLSSSAAAAEELLDWLNDSLQANYKQLEQLSSGAAYAQLIDFLYPGSVPLKMVKFRASQEDEYLHNFKIVQTALSKVGCDKEIPVSKLIFKKSRCQDNLEFLQWFKEEFFDANYDGHEYNALEAREHIPLGENYRTDDRSSTDDTVDDRQLVIADRMCPSYSYRYYINDNDDEDDSDDEHHHSLIDHNWSKKILELVGNKAQLMESFSWLSTVGGGFSSLGERDNKFSMRAASLSLGHQLKLAELLGDQRLEVMCHIFAALAALQLDNKQFCRNYITNVIMPMMNQLPYRDPILINMLKHIYFRLSTLDRFMLHRQAILNKK